MFKTNIISTDKGINVYLKSNTRARRLTLRFDQRNGIFILTHPKRARYSQLERFVQEKSDWISEHNVQSPALEKGSEVLLHGQKIKIQFSTKRRAYLEGAELYLSQNYPAASLKAFLRADASLYAPARIQYYEQKLGLKSTELRWRDTKSRWGSCDTHGRIMLCWRLSMASRAAFDYVIAHEVAHLKFMDHSEKYWQALETIEPNYRSMKAELRQLSHEIQSFRFDSA